MLKITALNLLFSGVNPGDTGGDCILIEADGKFGLIDAGGWTTQAGATAGGNGTPATMDGPASTITNVLTQRGVTKLEFFLITHFHYDHAMHADTIIKQFKPKIVYGLWPDTTKWPGAESYVSADHYWGTKFYVDKTRAALDEINQPLVAPTEGKVLKVGNATVTLYNTNRLADAYANGDYNIAAIVALIKYGNKKFFLPSDSRALTSEAIAKTVGKVDVSFIPHHGVLANTTPTLASTLDPEFGAAVTTIVSAQYLANSVKLFRLQLNNLNMFKLPTTVGGQTIHFETDGNTITTPTPNFLLTNEWIEDNRTSPSTWYWLNASGYVQTNNWAQVPDDGKWYHFGPDSKMQRGWFQDTDSTWYYLSKGLEDAYYGTRKFKDGEMHTHNWIKGVNGIDWFWLKDNGKMAKSESVYIPEAAGGVGKTFNFDANGVCLNP